ncbi:hypothetical protein [Helicobacter sp. MIT 14-3879]|uniref:hypothetical protein n=1 Tax=Helicobacter sp. MIT 14-3879 TaxID=2040649 RepID=UPI0015F15896|nr:hypothetical protein [Helicobacter sp. MIT 14-3879]
MTNKSLSHFRDSIHHSLKAKEKMDACVSANKKNQAQLKRYILAKEMLMMC